MLEGACHDAIRLLHDGDTHGAYKVLRNKLDEIDKIEASDYASVKWK
jgi:hypothetical protein